METTAIDNRQVPELTQAQTIKLRDVAKQFEAILLTQLTSSMNNIGSDEDSLFGNDGGADLAKKMFSEQLATAMADSGGIGIAEMMLRELGVKSPKLNAERTNPGIFSKTENAAAQAPVINRTARVLPVESPSLSNDFGIVSTDAQQNVDQIDETWRAPFASPENGIDYTNPANQKGENPVSVGYSMPVEGRISSRFGNRFHPIDRMQKFHGGIDIAAPAGTPINAAADGVVVFAGRKGGYGNLVIVEHPDGRLTRYAHAQTLTVSKGQKVFAGENIATVGSTGKATGPHLHFEVRENGKPVNPFGLMSKVSP